MTDLVVGPRWSGHRYSIRDDFSIEDTQDRWMVDGGDDDEYQDMRCDMKWNRFVSNVHLNSYKHPSASRLIESDAPQGDRNDPYVTLVSQEGYACWLS